MLTITENPRRLRALYILNIMGAGVPGAFIIAAPTWAAQNMTVGTQDPNIFGVAGSIWLAIGIVSVIGLWRPQMFRGIMAAQILYKSIWLLTVALPLITSGAVVDGFLVGFFIPVVIVFSALLFEPNRAPAVARSVA